MRFRLWRRLPRGMPEDALAVMAQLRAAAQAGAPAVVARITDGSFLEATLEAAIAEQLPGRVARDQQRRRFPIPGYEPFPHGVDIDWRTGDTHAGIEVKVSDVLAGLFDVVKLATAVAHGRFAIGFCAIAATPAQW